ncbi:penicillin acylase family protein [Chitinophaga sp. Mgbs1]|uniref:Penicillin acylase family protein n=1 Tax=Chitinophaga solisilvae TaxID=1233460 RepID=A0A433WPZ0_9BACT|nr:penicillin acylase family protein [Chitinophaga solisilvae]
MGRINPESVFPLLALIIITMALSGSLADMPPLGKFLDPFTGVVRNERTGTPSLQMPGGQLKEPVTVFFDERQVPHIYARHTQDLYFAQGFVTASLRLWQMDFLSYTAAGRLAEILGQNFTDYDRSQRRQGMLEAARSSLELMQQDPETIGIIRAYTRGVNAYIRQLHYWQLPVEYKMLNYEPEPWSDLKTVLVMKYFANTLSGYEEDFDMTSLMLALGEEKFNKYFPGFATDLSPVVNTKGAKNPALSFLKKPDYLNYDFMRAGTTVPDRTWNPSLGSNSWVVSGKKTRSGRPILCNDPHLNLTMPAIWLEMQLSAPGVNVYGVSVPGTPAVVIGFNEDIAWGITNGSDDVKDWYKLKISADYKKYELDGQWTDLKSRTEEIKVRGRKTVTDTVYMAAQGPVVYTAAFKGADRARVNHALRWSLHIPSNEILAYIKLNRARNYSGYQQAISSYSCPVLNFTFASKEDTIAVNHQGNVAVKWPGQGRFVLDGTQSSHLYTHYIPADSQPQSCNPPEGILVSANQHPTTDRYPYYYNGYYSEHRANRIREVLLQKDTVDIDDMMQLQLDNTAYFAVRATPALLHYLQGSKLPAQAAQARQQLQAWHGQYGLKDENALLYELWWNKVKDYTWDEFRNYPFISRVPDDYVLLHLLTAEPGNEYFDQLGTTQKETAQEVVTAAFREAVRAYDSIRKTTGSAEWGQHNKVTLQHMLHIAKLGVRNLPSAGAPGAVNAMSAGWGPSWRMIVEPGDRPRAWGVYPGGQSGDPASVYYDNFATTWNKGGYYELKFFMSADEAAKQTSRKWILR